MLHLVLQGVAFAARFLLPLVMLAAGLSLGVRELKASLRHPVVGRALLVTLVGVPLLAIAVVKILPVRPLAAGLILLMAVSPGCPILLVTVRQRPLVLALVLTLSGVAVLVLPAWLALLDALFSAKFQAPALLVFRSVLVPVLVPLALGLAVHTWAPRLAARLLPGIVWLYKGIIAAVVVLLLVIGWPALRSVDAASVLAMILIISASALLGHVAGGPRPEDRRLVAMAAVYGNPPLALFVASLSYPGLKLGPAIAVYILLRALALLPYKLWSRRAEPDS